jgi:hypothetical protein
MTFGGAKPRSRQTQERVRKERQRFLRSCRFPPDKMVRVEQGSARLTSSFRSRRRSRRRRSA